MKINPSSVSNGLSRLRSVIGLNSKHEVQICAEYGQLTDIECKPTSDLELFSLHGSLIAEETSGIINITYQNNLAIYAEDNGEAEFSDKAIFLWANSSQNEQDIPSQVTQEIQPLDVATLDQFPDFFFVGEDGKAISLPLIDAGVVEVSDTDVDHESDDTVESYVEELMGNDCSQIQLFFTTHLLPCGEPLRSSVSRSNPSEKSNPVTMFHHLVPTQMKSS
jgi:hypothetical protein